MLKPPPGWVFISADFSCLASGREKAGYVMFMRDKESAALWHKLPSTQAEDRQHGQELYAYGWGPTIEEASADAGAKAESFGPIHPE